MQQYPGGVSGSELRHHRTKAWCATLEQAGIEDFRRHNLRHCWASWHVQNGTPLFALQELDGWESPEMVRRHAHLAADHLALYAERLCAGRAVAVDGTNRAQGRKYQGLTLLQALDILVGRVVQIRMLLSVHKE